MFSCWFGRWLAYIFVSHQIGDFWLTFKLHFHVSYIYFRIKTALTWHIRSTHNLFILFLLFNFLLQYNPSCAIKEDNPKYRKHPKLGDRMHCVVYVINCPQVSVLLEPLLKKYKNIRKRISNDGRNIIFQLKTLM